VLVALALPVADPLPDPDELVVLVAEEAADLMLLRAEEAPDLMLPETEEAWLLAEATFEDTAEDAEEILEDATEEAEETFEEAEARAEEAAVVVEGPDLDAPEEAEAEAEAEADLASVLVVVAAAEDAAERADADAEDAEAAAAEADEEAAAAADEEAAAADADEAAASLQGFRGSPLKAKLHGAPWHLEKERVQQPISCRMYIFGGGTNAPTAALQTDEHSPRAPMFEQSPQEICAWAVDAIPARATAMVVNLMLTGVVGRTKSRDIYVYNRWSWIK
jgi:hypothetical protein